MPKKSKFSVKKKRCLKKQISKLDYNEHCEIYNLIRKDTDKISENANGVFINLKYLKDDTIQNIFDFVDYCKKNKTKMENENNIIKNKRLNQKKEIIERKDSHENLSQGYESYNLDNDFTYESTKGTQLTNDKFCFKNYIEKLSVNSQKEFAESKITSSINNRKIPTLKINKLKLSGVKARLMKRCRNINKSSNIKLNISNKCKKSIENILDDDYSLDKISTSSFTYDADELIDELSEAREELLEELEAV